MRRILTCVFALAAASVARVSAQQVFRSVQSANLPTAEILAQGSWLFEISHRFDTPVSDGASELWGFDGPAYNRLGLAYSVTDFSQVGVLRTNVDDNVELNAKVGLWTAGEGVMPTKVAVMGGTAFNTQVVEIDGAEDNELQAYAELIINTLVADRFALGLVPAYLHNQRLRDVDAHGAIVVGVHGQVYLTPSTSVFGEWLISPERTDLEEDPISFGIEGATRGHVFKLVVTNQARLNPTQVLAGSRAEFAPDEWRLGFNITRLLPF